MISQEFPKNSNFPQCFAKPSYLPVIYNGDSTVLQNTVNFLEILGKSWKSSKLTLKSSSLGVAFIEPSTIFESLEVLVSVELAKFEFGCVTFNCPIPLN